MTAEARYGNHLSQVSRITKLIQKLLASIRMRLRQLMDVLSGAGLGLSVMMYSQNVLPVSVRPQKLGVAGNVAGMTKVQHRTLSISS